ncbi:MAG: hypothetical protein CM15mP120_27840 [Pseudomonadota bacterium]|nr:MAG: hypothetical protein CM15mP120_27840 [Pseudomonadota bacterium]
MGDKKSPGVFATEPLKFQKGPGDGGGVKFPKLQGQVEMVVVDVIGNMVWGNAGTPRLPPAPQPNWSPPRVP